MRSVTGLDAVLQYGATFSALVDDMPVFLFCDSNTLFSSSEANSWGAALSKKGLSEAVALEGKLYSSARGIFTMSDYIAASFARDFHTPMNRIHAVGAGPNANPLELLALDRSPTGNQGPPTILFIGREFERKGGDVLVNAFRKLRVSIPDLRLVVVGPRDEMQLPEGAEWLGFLDRTSPSDWSRLKAAFERASVFCLPARHEPFGLVVLEAMYAALPVVATRIGALQEMVCDGSTGYLVKPDDANELADALYKTLSDPSAAAMGAAGRARATAKYSWLRVTEKIAQVISDTVKGATRPND